jgi:hypothetical protein
MPVYEYECMEHGTFEVLKTSYRERQEEEFCPICKAVCDSIASLVSMQPDKYWNGGFTPNGRYVVSTQEYAKAMEGIEPDTESNRRIVKAQKKAKALELKQKQEARLEKFISTELKDVTIDPDYNHLPGKRSQKQAKF